MPSYNDPDAMIQVFTISEPGGHAQNEDACEVRPVLASGGFLCAVADGQGGRAGGAAAAKRACSACLNAAASKPPAELLRPKTWTRIMQAADEAVCDDPTAGFTTLVALYVTSKSLCGASSGDSAAVLIRADQASEVLTARQHKDPPVGSGGASFVTSGASLTAPWTVLVMSDGVWKYAGLSPIIKIASTKRGEEMVAAIREKAKLKGSGGLADDFTLVMLADDGG